MFLAGLAAGNRDFGSDIGISTEKIESLLPNGQRVVFAVHESSVATERTCAKFIIKRCRGMILS
ncbi:MAG: hypothetical protein H0A75_00375 [Candidatus Methanofishera endochildressiae]|uniref:Uncharacterized protein n=1 Tax=Candidatus Methanofishera endochildressiae TaxID=2738884 RepID=A0A7Z0MMH8_9GAMM|nr:hypothetical protein [Candidatus Methanofishera endochildressiae]